MPDGGVSWSEATPKTTQLTTNDVLVPVPVAIYDLRDNETSVDLDKNGFELTIMNILTRHLDASHDIVFNHIIRSRAKLRSGDECDPTHKNPLFHSHVDHDPYSAQCKVKDLFGEEEAERVLQKRFQIINVWRPIDRNAIINNLLTICDYQTFDLNNDLHHADVRRSMVTKSSYLVSHNPRNAQKMVLF
ncbi:unnamed protein product [Adineta ricciae]|uniref:Uncharacterized protein n=1 Tax=Adineta ricciae TaxID=249248 RepID=A0A815A1S7_ADIRI|nr:unnamed protein product [Adineta ricciae]CAF1636425.1 unnamed protein product [Adineta ricciae]